MDSTLPDERSYRFVAVLNSSIEIGRLLNALGHMSAGLVGSDADASRLCFLQYRDREGGVHPGISHYPFIVLKADNSNQLRKFRAELISRQLPYTDFVDTMTLGTSELQLGATEARLESELTYFGVCTFGESSLLRELTKRFSLFRAL